MYATHPTKPSSPGAQPGYVMTQVDSWSLTGSPKSFRQGATAYRNGRDWAKRQRNQAIAHANKRAPDHASNAPSIHDSETSA